MTCLNFGLVSKNSGRKKPRNPLIFLKPIFEVKWQKHAI